MKCPKCQREVQKGSLYCQYCLTEIPWVKEFNSVETLMEKKKKEEEEEIPVLPPKKPAVRSRRVPKLLFAGLAVLLVLVAAGGTLYARSHTFEALYRRAEKEYRQKEYRKAAEDIQKALDQDGDNLEGNLLLGRIMADTGDYDSAALILQGMLRQYPDNVSVCGELMEIYVRAGRTDDVKAFMDACADENLRGALSEYICEEPVFSLGSGTYTSRQEVALSADYEKIYYTLDGSEPDRDSPLYEGPVSIPVGTTELKAFGVNELGIASNVVTARYVVVTGKPDAPRVTPESGDYSEKTRIELEIPEGCRGYYAFDHVPDQGSTEYTMPVSMPEGYHVFYAISVSANGEVSEPVIRNYYLQY